MTAFQILLDFTEYLKDKTDEVGLGEALSALDTQTPVDLAGGLSAVIDATKLNFALGEMKEGYLAVAFLLRHGAPPQVVPTGLQTCFGKAAGMVDVGCLGNFSREKEKMLKEEKRERVSTPRERRTF